MRPEERRDGPSAAALTDGTSSAGAFAEESKVQPEVLARVDAGLGQRRRGALDLAARGRRFGRSGRGRSAGAAAGLTAAAAGIKAAWSEAGGKSGRGERGARRRGAAPTEGAANIGAALNEGDRPGDNAEIERMGTGATVIVGTPEAETASGATTSAARTEADRINVAARTAQLALHQAYYGMSRAILPGVEWAIFRRDLRPLAIPPPPVYTQPMRTPLLRLCALVLCLAAPAGAAFVDPISLDPALGLAQNVPAFRASVLAQVQLVGSLSSQSTPTLAPLIAAAASAPTAAAPDPWRAESAKLVGALAAQPAAVDPLSDPAARRASAIRASTS